MTERTKGGNCAPGFALRSVAAQPRLTESNLSKANFCLDNRDHFRQQMPKQVLIVDDDPNTVKYLSLVLSESGYDPVSAADGSEGLEMARQAVPDLFVLDVMMPKKTGFVLFQDLKKDDRYRDIPVLMLTGVGASLEEMERHKDEDSEKPYDGIREVLGQKIREMREAGSVRPEMFIDKPVDPDTFIAKVRELIGD